MTPDHRSTILVVEDDDATRTFLADNLTADGFELLVADCARDGLRLLETKFPDLALVDLGLPDASGFELVRRVREADGIASRIDPRTPLVLVSGRTSELDRVRGFERGCDDYVCKPFSYPELRGRVGALLRRVDGRRALGRLRVGDLEVDPPSREVRLRGSRVELSQKEFALLRTLAGEPTRVFTKDELLRSIWGFRSRGVTRTLDSHACRLRHKLAVHGDHFVVNVWGVGYRLVDGPAEPAGVTTAATVLGWMLAVAGAGAGALLRRELLRRAAVVARAGHELRGPLTAIGMVLHAAGRDREAQAAGGTGAWARWLPRSSSRSTAPRLALADLDGEAAPAGGRARSGRGRRANRARGRRGAAALPGRGLGGRGPERRAQRHHRGPRR